LYFSSKVRLMKADEAKIFSGEWWESNQKDHGLRKTKNTLPSATHGLRLTQGPEPDKSLSCSSVH
jgi:hypothetical protein